MEFHQFYLGCLAQASYLVGSDGEAAIIDPRRDVDEYIAETQRRGLKIVAILETHLHADFVSGHLELSKRTGAPIYISHRAQARYPHRAVRDGDVIRAGNVAISVRETPGHTPESVCYVVTDETEPNARPKMVLTGDTLFIGDVGRPDLVGAKGFTADQMARMLYASLQEKVLTLDDDVLVYPGHGAGSLCGKNISKDTFSTIGAQRRSNCSLQFQTADEFVAAITKDQPEVPAYFPLDVELNRSGAPHVATAETLVDLEAGAVAAARDGGALVLDVRPSDQHASGHVPSSINIGLGGQFASWAGTLIPAERELVIVAESRERANEARMRLARVGLERVKGWLAGGIEAWRHQGHDVSTFPQITVEQLSQQSGATNATATESPARLRVIDVRRSGEWADGHVAGAIHAPLHKLVEEVASLDPKEPTAVICGGGYRSIAACAQLRDLGFTDLRDVIGGMAAWNKAALPVVRP